MRIPDIELLENHESEAACQRHLEVLAMDYDNCTVTPQIGTNPMPLILILTQCKVLDLLGQVEGTSESKLGTSFRNIMRKSCEGVDKYRYVAWDFHAVCGSCHFDKAIPKLSDLTLTIEPDPNPH